MQWKVHVFEYPLSYISGISSKESTAHTYIHFWLASEAKEESAAK